MWNSVLCIVYMLKKKKKKNVARVCQNTVFTHTNKYYLSLNYSSLKNCNIYRCVFVSIVISDRMCKIQSSYSDREQWTFYQNERPAKPLHSTGNFRLSLAESEQPLVSIFNPRSFHRRGSVTTATKDKIEKKIVSKYCLWGDDSAPRSL